MALSESVESLKGVGPKLGRLLSKQGIATIEDALYFLPRTYQDRTHLTPIAKISSGMDVTVFGKVCGVSQLGFGRQKRLQAEIEDSTGRLRLLWFRSYPSMLRELTMGRPILVYGNVSAFGALLQIVHPDYEIIDELVGGKPVATENFGRIIPVYSETEGLHQKTLRKVTAQALRLHWKELEDPLPQGLRSKLKLPDLRESLVRLHFPVAVPPQVEASAELARLVFEEFFILQLGLRLMKLEMQSEVAPRIATDSEFVDRFLGGLPFEMTQDQHKALAEILSDIARPTAMRRLVQGDVGSGKTVVALAALALVARAGFQGVFMAPTEVLALQHLASAQKFLEPLGVSCALLSHSAAEKKVLFARMKTGEVQVVVGTHALFQKNVEFNKLGLVVVDEQHRFGVDQRAELLRKAKGASPHLLMMTATPIPRTLALTVYGDLNMSWIREKPKGRTPVATKVMREQERLKVYDLIRQTLSSGQQAYLIYPLVDVSEKLDLKSATGMYERLRREVFPQFRLGLLHGRMKGEEKEAVLSQFKLGEIQLLISTTVIEVGIDVPNATLMIIEHPERLGLAQLHQLRGRVGRGSQASHCILLASKFVTERLRILEQTEDGFEIAEQDLRLRGPGEFLGTQQSGLPGFRVGHIVRDATLLRVAREEALALLERDPELKLPEHQRIRTMLHSRWKEKLSRLGLG